MSAILFAMSKKSKKYAIDPLDGLPAEVVGEWVINEKHERLTKYVNASRGARNKYPRAGSAYIDLFCGPGRVQEKDSLKFYDGGALVASSTARENSSPFNEVHIGDLDTNLLSACEIRLKNLGESVNSYNGPASETVSDVVSKLHPYGLYLAYLDPYNLDNLPFSVIEKLSSIQKMDMIIHVSYQDLARNLDKNLDGSSNSLDNFAPGWRSAIKGLSNPNAEMRSNIIEHWINLIRDCGMKPFEQFESVRGSKNQKLYWLLFVSRHKLADKLWSEIRNVQKQHQLL